MVWPGKSLTGLIDRLSWGAAMSGGLLMLVMVLTVVYGVIMRYVFRAPVAWSIDLPTFLFLIVTASGLAYVQRARGHIGVEILTARMPRKAQKTLEIVSSAAIIVFSAFILRASWVKALDHLEHNERTTAAGIPLFAMQLVFSLAMLLLCFQAIVEISRDIKKLRGSGVSHGEAVVENGAEA